MSNYSDSQFTAASENSSWFKALRLIPEDSHVLDIGCSSGNFGAELVERKKCTVDGIELDKKDAKLAKKKLRDVYTLNIETDDIKMITEKYDVIYMGDVIEHLFQPIQTLERIKKLLKSDGVIVFSIPNMAHISVRLLLLKGDFDYTETGLLDKTHVHFFNLKEVNRVFNEAGYKIGPIDFVEKDYPKSLIKKWCNDIGISVSDKYLKNTQDVDAAAFQFVGIAKKATKQIHELQQFGPIDFFESYHNNVVADYEKKLKKVNDELVLIRNSRTYKAIRKVRRLI